MVESRSGLVMFNYCNTTNSTSYETIPPVRLETYGGVLSTWWCNDATALAGYATMMMMMRSRMVSRPKV